MPKINKSLYPLLPPLLLIAAFLLLGADPEPPKAELVDPTRPPDFSAKAITSATGAQGLKLTATYIYPHRRMAIINGSIVKEGDQIDGFTITTITPYTVELVGSQNNKEILQLVKPVKQSR